MTDQELLIVVLAEAMDKGWDMFGADMSKEANIDDEFNLHFVDSNGPQVFPLADYIYNQYLARAIFGSSWDTKLGELVTAEDPVAYLREHV